MITGLRCASVPLGIVVCCSYQSAGDALFLVVASGTAPAFGAALREFDSRHPALILILIEG